MRYGIKKNSISNGPVLVNMKENQTKTIIQKDMKIYKGIKLEI